MISEQQFQDTAKLIGCDVYSVKAVNKVEAPQGCFQADGKLTILFEPYVFWKELRKRGFTVSQLQLIKRDNPEILSDVWNPALYGHYSQQWSKMAKAMQINKDAAYCSASYGSFQILGNNYASLGYKTPQDFVNFMMLSEANNLMAFAQYILHNHLDDEMRNHDWKGLAAGYNGSSYRKNNYDGRLKDAYTFFKNGGK